MTRSLLLLCLFTTPALAGPACPPDKEIAKRIDATFRATERYAAALLEASAKWKTDCEVARKDLLALEPEATQYWRAAMDAMKWMREVDASCRTKIQDASRSHAEAATIAKKYAGVEGQIKPVLERCKAHPGFQDAARKGLRVMKKKT